MGMVVVAVAAIVLLACSDDDDSDGTGAADGRRVAAELGCANCHGDHGQGGIGPAWQGLAGSTVGLEDGREVEADEDYIRRSIVDPDSDVVAGFSGVRMPHLDLTGEQLDALIAYIERLR